MFVSVCAHQRRVADWLSAQKTESADRDEILVEVTGFILAQILTLAMVSIAGQGRSIAISGN